MFKRLFISNLSENVYSLMGRKYDLCYTAHLMDIENTIVEIMQGRRKAPLLRPALKGVSWAYQLAIALRHFCYDRHLFQTYALDVPVVSVGNLVVGGTGKTPLIQLLCSHLQDKIPLAILTRGFKSRFEKEGKIERISHFSPQECGDEPYLLSKKTNAAIWVGADRVESGKRAIAEGAQCLLLDDGMQHRRLKRDFEIALVDGTNPFSEHCFLPCGLLRDTPKRLRLADLIVATHVHDIGVLNNVRSQIARYSNAPIVAVDIEILNRQSFTPGPAGLFCAIGSPSHFLRTAEKLKQEIVHTMILKDHEQPTPLQLEQFAIECRKKGARYILCTEKDAVKLPALSLPLQIVPVEMRLKIVSGQEHWEDLIETILAKVNA